MQLNKETKPNLCVLFSRMDSGLFGSLVKFQFLAQFPVNHIPYPVMCTFCASLLNSNSIFFTILLHSSTLIIIIIIIIIIVVVVVVVVLLLVSF